MDLAQTLLRSTARAFYSPKDYDARHIIMIDALVMHSAIRDDDLSYLMNMNGKDMHKITGRLREDRMMHLHTRPELREGQNRPVNRQWWYIDYRQAIDAIKWRVYTLDKAVQGNAVPASERKEYFCTTCSAEWTQMEVLDNVDPMHGFLCHRCGNVLQFDPERQAGGHEQSTKLNNQLKFITDLLPQLDSVHIPDNTFDVAYANHRPIQRDAQNQVAASTVVEDMAKPTAVRGVANTGPKSIAISITDADGPTDAEKDEERRRKEAIAKSNALPEWHTNSTVTGAAFGSNSASQSTIIKNTDDDDDEKMEDDLNATDQAAVDELFAKIQRQQEEDARRAREEEEDDDEEEEEEEEFEDIPPSTGGEKRPAPSSGDTSAADTPASSGDRAPKKVKVEEPANDADSDEEDMAFEDV